MNSLYFLLDAILRLYFWVVILAAIFSWLVGLGIVNRSNQIVAMFYEAVWNLTNPIFSYIREISPQSRWYRYFSDYSSFGNSIFTLSFG